MHATRATATKEKPLCTRPPGYASHDSLQRDPHHFVISRINWTNPPTVPAIIKTIAQ